jgi:hypothetical protein
LSGIARYVAELRLAWVGWRVDRLRVAHERLSNVELSLSRRLKKNR